MSMWQWKEIQEVLRPGRVEEGGFAVMPIYEYKTAASNPCHFCESVFEVRQKIDAPPLDACPKCGRQVQRLLSRSFIAVTDSLSPEDTFSTCSDVEADRMGLEGGFAADQVWE